ncbi:MAG: AEC family transporter [Chloroflexi bacterium]|nr:AEC family transporter [Chloroflexota bacterium]
MNNIITVLTQNILPIFIVAAFGYGLHRWKRLDIRPLSTIVMNCLSPALVFSSLVNSQLPGQELADIALFAVLNIMIMGGIGLLVSRLLRLSRRDTAALLIVIMFVNGGNYGLTLNQLRYGEAGLARAVVYYLTSTMILYTLGIFIASAGHLSLGQAARRLVTFPAVYAAVLAIIVYNWQIELPGPLLRGIEIAGAGAIPVMLLVLGMQIARVQGRPDGRLSISAISLRLLIGPLVGIFVAGLVGLSGFSRSTSIIEASMPPAVFTIILATEFNLQPSAVTGIVVISTLLSPFTIAAVITLAGL